MPWEPHDPASYLVHVIFGFTAFGAAIVALVSQKGSKRHISAGKIFAYLMLLVALSTYVFMRHEVLTLAIVMATAVLYLIPSAMLAFHTKLKYFLPFNLLLAVIPLLLGIFAAIQFVRMLASQPGIPLGPLILATTFLWLATQDMLLVRTTDRVKNFWIRRHMVRMLLAFTFAAMALVRIGMKVGLTLEQTVIFPMLIFAVTVVLFYRRYPVKQPTQQQ